MADPTKPFTFEKDLAELEAVLRDLEDGTTTLQDALTRYEKGVVLLRSCYSQLRDAEQRIQQLAGCGPDGSPELKPFTHVAAVDKTRPPVRKPRPENGTDDSQTF